MLAWTIGIQGAKLMRQAELYQWEQEIAGWFPFLKPLALANQRQHKMVNIS
jgi:hypothetical protein